MLGRELKLSARSLAAVEDPAKVVATRTGLGGAAAGPVKQMLAECGAAFRKSARWRAATESRLTAAERQLVDLARKRGVSNRTRPH